MVCVLYLYTPRVDAQTATARGRVSESLLFTDTGFNTPPFWLTWWWKQQPQGPMFILAFEPHGRAVTVRSRAAEQSGRARSQRARRHVFLGGIIHGSKDREEPVFGTAGGSQNPRPLKSRGEDFSVGQP